MKQGWRRAATSLCLSGGLAAAFALGAQRLVAQDESRWAEVAADSAVVIAIDTVSMVPLGDSIYRVWERTLPRASDRSPVLARADFDCTQRVTRTVEVALAGRAPVPASAEEAQWTEILPGSPYEAELQRVCSHASQPKAPR
jgi:hypothetical protein